jgi:phage-related baseplate assembly protein
MNRIDLSKLPPPQLVEEMDFEVILAEMRARMRELCPEWTGYELESDPANKVMETAAYREMLIRQRVNEAVRGVMVAFAAGYDLDNLAAFYPVSRLPGANATFAASLKLSSPLDVDATIPAGYTVVAKNGEYEASLLKTTVITPGETSAPGTFEVVRPAGANGNGLSLSWDAITPLPFVATIEQMEASHGGGDPESDDAFRVRASESLEGYSTCGAFEGYRYWAKSADARIADVSAWTSSPGVVALAVLSREGDGTADTVMLQRVREMLSPDTRRPGTDQLDIASAEIVPYDVTMTVVTYPGVAGEPPFDEAARRVREKVKELHGLGVDVTRTALISAAHAEGVKEIELLEPADDIRVARHQAARCIGIEIGSRVADDR